MKKTAEQWTDKDFWREARRMMGKKATADEMLCAAVMLVALVHGANRSRIAQHLKVADKEFGWMFDNLRRNGVFMRNGRVRANWFDKENGGMEFILDASVGLGMLAKTPA